MSSAPPQLVADRYRLMKPLGQGGMGRVWKARDEVLHRDVAIKELVPPPGLTDDERREMRERSLREARAIARLNHGNVVRVFDVLRTDGDPWIVMEYVPSRSLQDVIAADGPLPATRVAEIGLGMLGALRAAHRAGVMHRDVKPGNVLLGEDGRVVLTDFGLATVPGDPNVTRTGLVLGSPAYIAPERARDGTALPEGDLWSLGATLYAAVEGQSPFARPSAIGTLSALATEPIPPPKNAGPLKAVLLALLQKDPAERADAETAERLLRRAASGRRGRSSLLDGVRRPSPGGQREERRTATPVPLPAPRPSSESAAPAERFAPGRSSIPAQPVPAAEPTEAVAPAAATEPVSPVPVSPGATSVAPRTVPATAPLAAGPAPAAERAGPVYPGQRSGNRRLWLVGGLVALLLLGLLVTVPLLNDDARDTDAGPGTSVTGKPTGDASQAPPATSAPPTQAPTPSATASPTGTPTPVIPAGWKLHKDPTGFSVPVPEGWTMERENHGSGREDVRVYFRDPNSARMLLIDQTTTPLKDAEADWRRQEAYRKGSGMYPGYQRVRIVSVDYGLEAADWEWLFNEDGIRMHVRNRGFVTAKDKGYAIRWDVPAKDWDANLKNFDIIAANFRPVRGSI